MVPGGEEAAAVPSLDSLGVTKHVLAGSAKAQRQRILASLQRGQQDTSNPSDSVGAFNNGGSRRGEQVMSQHMKAGQSPHRPSCSGRSR